MEIVTYHERYLPEMAALFYNTVHIINQDDYTPKQLDAWATGKPNLATWDASFKANYTLLAFLDGVLVGFGDIALSGYLDRLYVHYAYQRKGVATALCDALEAYAHGRIITLNASITAKPFFEKRGYVTLGQQQVERYGVWLTSYTMKKQT